MDGGRYRPSPKRRCEVFALWRNEDMTSYRKRPRNSAQPAKLMIDIASGEVSDRESPKKKTTKRKPPSRKSSRTKARSELL